MYDLMIIGGGPAGSLLYDTGTGRLTEYEPQDYEEVL